MNILLASLGIAVICEILGRLFVGQSFFDELEPPSDHYSAGVRLVLMRELDAIAAAVIGGVSLSGGRCRIADTVVEA